MKAKIQNFLKYTPLLKELVSRDLKVKYRRSFLGYVWSLLNPMLMMMVMSIVFSFMFKSNIPYFNVYLITGNTLFAFFNESTNQAMTSILANGSLIRKVYIPKYIFPVSRVLSAFTNLTFSLAAIIIVMAFSRVPLHWTILLFWVPLVLLLLFCIGCGLFLAAIATFFRDITYIYSVITLALTYLTPIFYPVDAEFLPSFAMAIIKMNPMYYYLTFFRQVVVYGAVPGAELWIGCTVSCILALVIGFAVFRKLQKNFILYL